MIAYLLISNFGLDCTRFLLVGAMSSNFMM